MEFKTLTDLRAAIVKGSATLPRDIDLVVGVPRSGLLAANLLALHRNLPLTDVDGLLAGRLLAGGQRERFNRRGEVDSAADWRRILVLDDSLASGTAMRAVREQLAGFPLADRLVYGAVYVTPGRESLVDYAFESCRGPRFFEWNFMHHSILAMSCVDIDGVLCVDPTADQNDDGPRYRDFLTNALPFHVPSAQIATLVTCRLERYRPETEAWLADHGVKYGQLVMLDLPSKAERLKRRIHASFKAEVYRRTHARLFIESNGAQAAEIAALALRPVFCVESGSTYFPPASRLVHAAAKKAPRVTARRVTRAKTALRDWFIERLKY
ncbi:MAG: phosphoribosyltransferase [Vicinamibacterales bacterium]